MDRLPRINHEVEVGYDDRFEHRWRLYELAGRVVMLLVVAAALLGLLGRGPYSHHRIAGRDGAVWVDFEPVARYDTATQITFHLVRPVCADGATVRISGHFAEPMGLSQLLPEPLSAVPLPDGMTLHYPLAPFGCAGTMLRLYVKPSAIGPIALSATVDDGPPLRWHQFVMP